MPFSNELNSCQMFLKVLNEDPAVWLERARHANRNISHSFPGKCTLATAWCNHTKNTFAFIKNWQNFVKSLYIQNRNQRESEFVKCKI
jgi:hypothetical protein